MWQLLQTTTETFKAEDGFIRVRVWRRRRRRRRRRGGGNGKNTWE